MKALYFKEHGTLDVIQYGEVPVEVCISLTGEHSGKVSSIIKRRDGNAS